MSRAEDPRCLCCGHGEDSAEHTVFHCSRWREHKVTIRDRLYRDLRTQGIQTFVCGPDLTILSEDAAARESIVREATELRSVFLDIIKIIIMAKKAVKKRQQALT